MKQLCLRYKTLYLVHIILVLLVGPTDHMDVSIAVTKPTSIGTLILLQKHLDDGKASANNVRLLYISIFLDILLDYKSVLIFEIIICFYWS